MAVYTPDQLTTVGNAETPVVKGAIRTVPLFLYSTLSEEDATAILDTEVSQRESPSQFLFKSMFDFDVSTTEGIDRLLYLITVLDAEIVKLVVTEIWPGYPVESEGFSAEFARMQIKGFLLDVLEGHGIEQEGQAPVKITDTEQLPDQEPQGSPGGDPDEQGPQGGAPGEGVQDPPG